MTAKLNILYGMLTNGDNTRRKTTVDSANNPTAIKIISALIPPRASAECKRALAELYIRLIQTDKNLQSLLSAVDPLNSYKLQSFRESFEEQGIIEEVVTALKTLGIPGEENSALPFDHIRNGLKMLLEVLNGSA